MSKKKTVSCRVSGPGVPPNPYGRSLRTEEAAEELGYSKDTLRRWRMDKKHPLKWIKTGKKQQAPVRYKWEAVWLFKQRVNPGMI